MAKPKCTFVGPHLEKEELHFFELALFYPEISKTRGTTHEFQKEDSVGWRLERCSQNYPLNLIIKDNFNSIEIREEWIGIDWRGVL